MSGVRRYLSALDTLICINNSLGGIRSTEAKRPAKGILQDTTYPLRTGCMIETLWVGGPLFSYCKVFLFSLSPNIVPERGVISTRIRVRNIALMLYQCSTRSGAHSSTKRYGRFMTNKQLFSSVAPHESKIPSVGIHEIIREPHYDVGQAVLRVQSCHCRPSLLRGRFRFGRNSVSDRLPSRTLLL